MKKIVAILATDGFEEIELTSPKKALEEAGAEVHIISPKRDSIKAWDNDHWSETYKVDHHVSEVDAKDYHSLMLPGGVMNPDQLRQDKTSIEFITSFFEQKKPVSAICHGIQPLIDADVLKGRKLTSYPSLRKDVENAGGNWVDEEVVVDQGFTTSRTPEDLDAFNNKLVEEVREGKHEMQHA
ncbi:protease I [Nonlabens dokdonensis]|jgi:protease I|uniref:Intracellular protease, PfpI family n=2 Tax=Nonlabens dokdonensis TaxID=328515 RepID=L7W8T0_NONDD|nr:type 1 glutamine amidotransferase domain-containing protein [Nonlabens dokdonensis]AGC78115.1 intracellular protease, PfpI family [Nonlabens dokdonensis DSW-6]PZX37176.1 protease I [Nonlabens dokdonensis]